jgi:anti-anti-sigma factor
VDYPLFDVFISYAHEDVEWARALYTGLTGHRFSVFLDEAVLRFGDNVPAEIEQSLEHSIAVLLLISRKSRDSAWTKFEASFNWASTFIDGERNLIPVIVEKGCELPPRLRNLRACEFTSKSDMTIDNLAGSLLSRNALDIGTYTLDRSRLLPPDLLKRIVQCVDRYMTRVPRELLLIEAAITELVDNAFRHHDKGPVSLKVHSTRRAAEITVHDEGSGFDLRGKLGHLARTVDADPTVIGGRGLTLLEAQGVTLENGWGEDSRHWTRATVPLGVSSPGWPRDSVEVRDNGSATITLPARIADGPAEQVMVAVARDPATSGIVLDLSSVDYVSSIALRTLGRVAQAAAVNRSEVVLANVQPAVAEALHIARYHRIFKIFESRRKAEEAIDESLQKRDESA